MDFSVVDITKVPKFINREAKMSERIHNSSPQQRATLPGLSKEDKKYTLDLIVIPVYRALSDMDERICRSR